MQTTLIIGAGAIGLQSARLLALAGCNVTLIDQSAVGQEASWAGGGIVSPLYPWRYSEAITALAHHPHQRSTAIPYSKYSPAMKDSHYSAKHSGQASL